MLRFVNSRFLPQPTMRRGFGILGLPKHEHLIVTTTFNVNFRSIESFGIEMLIGKTATFAR
ncbi:hypothetical protein Q31b_29330 [Novipirellula aureliae]|uniref:Uncharacterized protein n=1 Tax=Novipirellula aureliae TaxID=2527966 RepID=A0A5C6DZ30_9BACT|nr:hypothetical protein Q31b_29330 [Novipirellula aureliae]